jgi:ribonuclease Z
MNVTRRDVLKASGLAVGGLALADKLALAKSSSRIDTLALAKSSGNTSGSASNRNSLFDALQPCHPQHENLANDEMRISFLGSWYCPRLAQECNSVFVELGNGDSFVFDCGSGVMGKYNALGVPLSRMNKIFLTHLHGDHMSDLMHIYSFGPAYDRKVPLYVWGPTMSNVPDPVTGQIYNDGTIAYCQLLREAARWHTESFSFQSTEFVTYDIPSWTVPTAPPDKKDAYDLVPFECPWAQEGFVAYQYNNVKITSFPAVHARQGSISYKLEWTIGNDHTGKPIVLSMIFTGDTKPNNYVIRQATQGVDVLIHEMTTSPEIWTQNFTGLTPADGAAYTTAVAVCERVIESSHTPEKAFGYILSKLAVPPRLAVGTHFPATDDTISEAFDAMEFWYPKGDVTVASDFMVLNVTRMGVRQRRAVVSDYSWATLSTAISQAPSSDFVVPKYHDVNGLGNPYAQLDPKADVIPPSVYDPS